MNKQLILTLLLTGFLSTISFGQSTLGFGLKGGVNFATIEGESADEVYGNRTGYHAGAFALMKFQRLGIQPEVMFSSQGATIDFGNQTVEEQFNYVNIPILLKFYPTDFLNIHAGPQFGFMLDAYRKGDNSMSVNSIYKDSDLSIATGVGVDLPFGLNIEGRYNIGVSDINDNPDTQAALSNQVYQVSVGFNLFQTKDE